MVSIFLSGVLSAVAQPQSLNELKEAFAGARASYVAKWDTAQKMRVLSLDVSTRISAQECEVIMNRIQGQYPYSLSEQIYERGAAHFSFCRPGGYGNRYVPDTFYFGEVSGANQFGVEIRYALVGRGRAFIDPQVTKIFLDAEYRILEINSLVSLGGRNAEDHPFEASVTVVDREGNYFDNMYDPRREAPQYERQMYSSSDGKIKGAFRFIRPRRADKGQGTVTLEGFSNVPQSDWTAFHLPITLGFWGGYYRYNEKIYSDPANEDKLSRYFFGGREVCADGSVTRNREATRFLATPSVPGDFCGNEW